MEGLGMDAKGLIAYLQANGFSIDCQDSELLVFPADELTEGLKRSIRENKSAILAELQAQATLEDEIKAGKKYAVLVDDASTDPVLVKVGIRGIGTFELAIPHAHYDGLALLEVIEQHSLEAERKPGGNVYPFPDKRSVA
jgi:hypothetical protein